MQYFPMMKYDKLVAYMKMFVSSRLILIYLSA